MLTRFVVKTDLPRSTHRFQTMHEQPVEIYSDATNAAVMRHPARRFPGLLMQGDTLHGLVQQLASVYREVHLLGTDVADDLTDIRDRLQSLLDHYEATLSVHNIDLPYSKT